MDEFEEPPFADEEKPKVVVIPKKSDEDTFTLALEAIAKVPNIIQDAFNRHYRLSEKKAASKEKIEILQLQNEKHDTNWKGGLIGAIILCATVCYCLKGLDSTISNIFCFAMGYITNGFSGFNKQKGNKPDSTK